MADIIRKLEHTAEEIDSTIDEVADARGSSESLGARISGKVDKETGKGLSTNDFTTADKTKLDDLAEIKSIGTGLNLDSSTGELTATGGGGGTSDYSDLTNKPQINSVTLSGNKSLSDLGITHESKTAASGGTALSLVTTGEKYAWNNKQNAIDDLSTIRSGAALGATAVQPETGKGLSTNDFTTTEKTKLAGIAEGAEVNVQSNWTQTTTTADDYIKNKPTLGTAAAKNATDTYNATGTDVTTGKAVAAALATLPEPMVFKGSLGTGGTITTLSTASSSNKGYVYKVITAGTYASQSAKVGDTFISDGSAWVLIPSGDEPSGTVTNVAVVNGGGLTVSGSPITSSGTITVGHSNSVTAKTSSSVKKFTYDEHGHVTGSSELSTAESNALASGIDSTKVEQIETNKNNISKLVDAGAKNLLNLVTPTTINRMTITDAGNGSVTASCSNVTWANSGYEFSLTAGKAYKFIIYMDSASVSDVFFQCFVNDISGSTAQEIGRTSRITSTGVYSVDFVATSKIRVSINLNNSGTAATGSATYHAMLCTMEDYNVSTEFVPYAKSNYDLTALSAEDRASLVELVDGGAKNYFDISSTVTNYNATTTVDLTTGKVSVTSAGAWARSAIPVSLPAGNYIFSTAITLPSGDCRIQFNTSPDGTGSGIGTPALNPTESGEYSVPITLSENKSFYVMLYNNPSASGDTRTVVYNKLMLCTKAAWGISHDYQPYRPSYQELYERVIALEQANQ